MKNHIEITVEIKNKALHDVLLKYTDVFGKVSSKSNEDDEVLIEIKVAASLDEELYFKCSQKKYNDSFMALFPLNISEVTGYLFVLISNIEAESPDIYRELVESVNKNDGSITNDFELVRIWLKQVNDKTIQKNFVFER